MNKEISGCPWCGAHYTQEESIAALKKQQHICPVCGHPVQAVRSRKRVGRCLLLAAALSVLDYAFFTLSVPLLAVYVFTVICTGILWCFRGRTVVFRKIAEPPNR